MDLKAINEDPHADLLFIDQLRDIFQNSRNDAVKSEEESAWAGVLAVNSLILHTALYLVFSTMWMITLSANLHLHFLALGFGLYFLCKLLGD